MWQYFFGKLDLIHVVQKQLRRMMLLVHDLDTGTVSRTAWSVCLLARSGIEANEMKIYQPQILTRPYTAIDPPW